MQMFVLGDKSLNRSTSTVKFKTFGLLQEKRRKDLISLSQQRRQGFIDKKRQTLLTEINNPNSQLPAQFFNTPNDNTNNMSNKRKEEAQKDLLRRRAFSQSICIPEWMVEIPTDLQENWICIPRPDGKRFILSSKKGKTVLYGINGYSKVVKSDLPGGMFNYRGNCVLDVIQGENCFFAMDLISFNNTDYSDSECESRLFTLYSRLNEQAYYLIYQNKKLPIYPIEYLNCSTSSLTSIYSTSSPSVLNGYLFINRFSTITEGSSPLQLLWKDSKTSRYVINTDARGVIQENQEVTLLYKNESLLSLEGVSVGEGTLEGVEDNTLVKCEITGVYLDEELHQWRVRDLQVKGIASYAKTLPETMSKIIFQQMARECPLTFEQIVQTIKC